VKLDTKYIVQGTKCFSHVFRSSQTQGGPLSKVPKSQQEQLDYLMQPIESIIVPKTRKRPAWLEATLQEAERLKAPSGIFREIKKPKRFSSYATCMTKLINEEPTTFEEATRRKNGNKP
jgi:hypothetical protein